MIHKLLWNSLTRGFILWILSKLPFIKKGRIVCICWGGAKYNCNPRAITDKMLKEGLVDKSKKDSFEIIYAFLTPEKFAKEIPQEFISVDIGSLKYYYYLSTANIIIANTRFGGSEFWPFKKKKKQYYIQTMHGGHGIKKVELDIKERLSKKYIETILEDASRIDLMLSDSSFWTNCARTAFSFPEGEILEVGLPRNDIFFEGDETRIRCRKLVELVIVEQKKSLMSDPKYLVYCPTFRNNSKDRKGVYGFEVDSLIAALETRFGGYWYILVSSHPNMRSYYKRIYDFSHLRMIDIGEEELQPMLMAGDAALTDYSSAGFEFSLTKKPVFLLCKDAENYDRGFYFNPEDLPFPYSIDEAQLLNNILSFNNEKYQNELSSFNEKIGLKETGRAGDELIQWIMSIKL